MAAEHLRRAISAARGTRVISFRQVAEAPVDLRANPQIGEMAQKHGRPPKALDRSIVSSMPTNGVGDVNQNAPNNWASDLVSRRARAVGNKPTALNVQS
jgi:hypothetical protein